MITATVHRILSPTFVDGPGSRMAVFLQGCHLHCLYCHNPETLALCHACGACIPACPEGALALEGRKVRHDAIRCRACDACQQACSRGSSPRCRVWSVEELLGRVRSEVPFLDGLTFSGGECSLQADFVIAAARRIRAETGLSVLADTNGEMAPETLEALGSAVDGFLFDLKALDPTTHERLTGCPNTRILANLRRAAHLGKVREVRTVVVPGFTDSDAEIAGIAGLVRTLGSSIPWRLSPFRLHGVRTHGLAEPSPERFQALVHLARTVLGEARVLAPGNYGFK